MKYALLLVSVVAVLYVALVYLGTPVGSVYMGIRPTPSPLNIEEIHPHTITSTSP